ncbi:hypothetical protein LCGC14_1342220 [marine sediment metagenome]|uniref:Uncharacterized protein n=1 Tax=marine sediment metagenome TaxID=412755 RepID=A0A0F9KE20_9ZZZZ
MLDPNMKLFCPNCKEKGVLWVRPRLCYRVECEVCGGKWENNELREICFRLIEKARADRMFQHWAVCLGIQMQHTINPYTGRCYA